jgi:hypothetical protein
MYRLVILILSAALALLFFNQLAFSGLILARGDTYAFFYPLWAARDAALSQLSLPLWSPTPFMGVPLLADPQLGTLYPPNWLTIPLTPPDAVRVSVLLHVAWAVTGAYFLARRALDADFTPSLIAGALFGLGGYLGTHIEQINQLQGLAWMPWAFLVFYKALTRPLARILLPALRGSLRYVLLLALIFTMQILSGHTQTVFVTCVGLALYGLIHIVADIRGISFLSAEDWRLVMLRRLLRVAFVLGFAALIGAVIALPQLLPSLQLTGLSNRGSGFSAAQVLAFSWNPLLIGRGMLPSYDAQVFGEYVAYIGVIGLALALLGAFRTERFVRFPWVLLSFIAVILALGMFNPLNWTIAELPGFNLFRVPARWLSLLTLSLAMLAAIGAQTVLDRRRLIAWHTMVGVAAVLIPLAMSTLLAGPAQAEVDGPAVPTALTFAAWAAAFVLFINLVLLRQYAGVRVLAPLLLIITLGELLLASSTMPYNDLVDRQAFDDRRFTAYQLQAVQDNAPPGRFLSISAGFFDPGDLAALNTRYDALGLSDRARRYALTAAKLKELGVPNLPLLWDTPTIDGFGGGVLPTVYYTQFTSLMLPDGMPRTIDGRLRELLALPDCGGACIPDQRWLNLTNTRYLILDKTFDAWHDDINYDTAFAATLRQGQQRIYSNETGFLGDQVRVLADVPAEGGGDPLVTADGALLSYLRQEDLDERRLYTLNLLIPSAPQAVQVRSVGGAVTVYAVTLVDSRTGDFIPLHPQPWSRILSSDIKLYENADALPRAFVVHQAQFTPDTWDGTETALAIMHSADFDPADEAVLAGGGEAVSAESEGESRAEITAYTDTRVEIAVNATADGYLLLTDAYFPGWRATVNGQPVDLLRANVMFRAVSVTAGESTVVFEYAPQWWPWAAVLAGLTLLAVLYAYWRIVPPDEQ